MSRKKFFTADDHEAMRQTLRSTLASLEGADTDRDGGMLRRVAYLSMVAKAAKALTIEVMERFVEEKIK